MEGGYLDYDPATGAAVPKKLRWYHYILDRDARAARRRYKTMKTDGSTVETGIILPNGTKVLMPPETFVEWQLIPEHIKQEMLVAMNEEMNAVRARKMLNEHDS